ncbi:MAG: short-chain dehydrogenase, partial [Pseudomonadota bacterium]
EIGYGAMERGELLKINERSLDFMLNWVVPFMPRKQVLKTARKFMEKH